MWKLDFNCDTPLREKYAKLWKIAISSFPNAYILPDPVSMMGKNLNIWLWTLQPDDGICSCFLGLVICYPFCCHCASVVQMLFK